MALIRCTECGNEVSDKAAACPRCGCPITPGAGNAPAAQAPQMVPAAQAAAAAPAGNAQAADTGADTMPSREQLNAIGGLLPSLNELTGLLIKQGDMEKKLATEKTVKERRTLSMIAMIIFLLFLALLIFSITKDGFSELGKGFAPLMVFLILWLIALASYDKVAGPFKTAKKQYPQVMQRLGELQNGVNWQPLVILPQKYRHGDAVSFIYDALVNMRATSIKESINLYEQELHNRAMMGAQMAILQQTREATNAATAAAVTSAIGLFF